MFHSVKGEYALARNGLERDAQQNRLWRNQDMEESRDKGVIIFICLVMISTGEFGPDPEVKSADKTD